MVGTKYHIRLLITLCIISCLYYSLSYTDLNNLCLKSVLIHKLKKAAILIMNHFNEQTKCLLKLLFQKIHCLKLISQKLLTQKDIIKNYFLKKDITMMLNSSSL